MPRRPAEKRLRGALNNLEERSAVVGEDRAGDLLLPQPASREQRRSKLADVEAPQATPGFDSQLRRTVASLFRVGAVTPLLFLREGDSTASREGAASSSLQKALQQRAFNQQHFTSATALPLSVLAGSKPATSPQQQRQLVSLGVQGPGIAVASLPMTHLQVDRKFTLEQIWGQLNVAYAPLFSAADSQLQLASEQAATWEEALRHLEETKHGKAAVQRPAKSRRDGDLARSATAALLHAKPAAKKKRRGDADGDDAASSADDDERKKYFVFGGGDDEDEDEEDGAMDVDGRDDEGDANDAGDERAALEELYGEDGVVEGDELLGDEENEDDEAGDEEEPSQDEEDETDENNGDPSSETAGRRDRSSKAKPGGGDSLFQTGDGFVDEFFEDDMASDEAGEVKGAEEEAGISSKQPKEPFAGHTEEEEDVSTLMTPFQIAERGRLRHVRDAEESRVFGANWAMKGEVGASNRPRDSLLEDEAAGLLFDHGAKSVPVITETFTAKLEDRIKKRIVDKNFDDVQRKVKRTTTKDLLEVRRDTDADSKKSKLSLVDLYEKEFVEKQKRAEEEAARLGITGDGEPQGKSAEPLTEVEKDELKAIQMFKRLAQHLDALSNFYFTPQPATEELDARVRAVSNRAPAIALESVGLLAKTTEAALAPQDVYRPYDAAANTGPTANEEKTPQERQTYRRAQKRRGQETAEKKASVAAKTSAKKAKPTAVMDSSR